MNNSFGILGLTCLRSIMKDEVVSISQFKERMKALNISLVPFEIEQIIAYITPSTEEIDTAAVVRCIQGRPMSNYNPSRAKEIYAKSDGSW